MQKYWTSPHICIQQPFWIISSPVLVPNLFYRIFSFFSMLNHLTCVNHSSIKKATYLKERPIRSSHIGNLSKETISNCILGTVVSSVSQKHIICSNFFGWICLPKHSLKKCIFLLQQSSSQKATSQNLAYLGILCSVLK